MIEMSKLQGIEISLMPTLPAANSAESPTPNVSVVTNKGNGGINLRLTPALADRQWGFLRLGNLPWRRDKAKTAHGL